MKAGRGLRSVLVVIAGVRSKGPYAVAVVVIATLKCAGGKKGEREVVERKKKHADPRDKTAGMSWMCSSREC